MTTNKVFNNWNYTHLVLWGHQPIQMLLDMHTLPLLSRDQLAKLIESYPREPYSLVQTGTRGSDGMWREGENGNLCGQEFVEAITGGGLRLNMCDVSSVDPAIARCSTACSRMSERGAVL